MTMESPKSFGIAERNTATTLLRVDAGSLALMCAVDSLSIEPFDQLTT